MKKYVFYHFLISIVIFFCGCSGTRSIQTQDHNMGCNAKVLEDAFIPGKTPDDSIEILKKSFGPCYSRFNVVNITKEYACQNEYELASLVNIQRPNFWTGLCYQARVHFYNDSTGYEVSDHPIVLIDSISPDGFYLQANLGFGFISSGSQSETGLVSDRGDEANSSQISFGLDGTYYPTDFLGLRIGGKYISADASAPQTPPMSYFDELLMNYGIEIAPFNYHTIRNLLQFYAAIEGTYSFVKFNEEYRNFLLDDSFVLTNETATGFGYSLQLGFRQIFMNDWFINSELGFRSEYPAFPSFDGHFDGHVFTYKFGGGYKF